MSGHLDSAEWGPILYKDITTSTMDDARQAVTEGAGHGTVCAAGTQEGGRGRVALCCSRLFWRKAGLQRPIRRLS